MLGSQRAPAAAVSLLLFALAGCGSTQEARLATARGGAPGVSPAARTAPGGARGASASTASPESAEVRKLIALGRPIYCAAAQGNEVALTFDDGPGPYTHKVIAKLGKHHAQATFFIVGRNIAMDPGATRRERALGAVGDHTFTHPLLTALASSAAERQIVQTQAALARSSGGPVFLFRPPYGAHDHSIDRIARAHGLLQILWTVDSRDSLGANYRQIEGNVIGGLRGGAIILMHENHGQTVRALPSIFAALARRHLRAVSVPRLLTDQPPSAARVRAGGAGCAIGARAARSGS
jgi:peptidoglycan/xylan/chitin deacetylase (PgdA/CDA1 family)